MKNFKKLLSLALSLIMVLSVMPVAVGAVVHQPTAGEPYFEISEETATYQWYSVEKGVVEITDENAFYKFSDYELTDSVYTEQEGWKSESGYVFMRGFEKGDVVTFRFSCEIESFALIYGEEDAFIIPIIENNEAVVIIEETADNYQVISGSEESTYEGFIRAYLETSVGTPLEGETESRIRNPQAGKQYYCVATLSDGTQLTSDSFICTCSITHQPTAAEPYVKISSTESATYQWYSVEKAEAEITDENAFYKFSDYGLTDSVYTEQEGWKSESGYVFMRGFEKGDVVTFRFSCEIESFALMYGEEDDYIIPTIENNEAVVIIEETADNYQVMSGSENGVYEGFIRAFVKSEAAAPAEGETLAEIKTAQQGKEYYCVITLSDGTQLTSDSFTAEHIHSVSEQTCRGYYCSDCSEWYGQADENAHSFTKYETVIASDCENKGKERSLCDYGCGKTDERELAARGHSYTSLVTPATCTEQGYTTYTCSECKDSYVADETPAAGHKDENKDNICDSCSLQLAEICENCAREHNGFFRTIICYIISFFRIIRDLFS